jgi:hypothetical protein
MTPPDDPELSCADGFHDTLIPRLPVDEGASVTIDWECPRCGRVVCSDSWTKAAWQAHQDTPARPRVTDKEE